MIDKIFDFLDNMSFGMIFVLGIIAVFIFVQIVQFIASIIPAIVIVAALGFLVYIIVHYDRSK